MSADLRWYHCWLTSLPAWLEPDSWLKRRLIHPSNLVLPCHSLPVVRHADYLPIFQLTWIESFRALRIIEFNASEILFDADGRLITDSTWEYKPPCTLTIPVDFRISLRNSDRSATRMPIANTVLLMAQDGAAAAKSNVAVLVDRAMQAVEQGLPLTKELGLVRVLNRATLMADPVLRKEMEDATAAALHSAKCSGEPPLILAVSVFCALTQGVLAARIEAGQPGWFQLDAPATVARIQEACLVDREQLQLARS
jgi:hypothetical protein